MSKYIVEFSNDNAVARTLLQALKQSGTQVTRGVSLDEYPLCHCPACGASARIMRKCEDLKMLVPVFEAEDGIAQLDWTEWESQPDVGDTDPQYVCENCGHLLFDSIEKVDEWLKKHPKKGRERCLNR